ncbi:response regulator [Pseudobacteriovorax antillogorgiicola]|uniref:Response regulator receiver domain-containing protein n=1 Tax=Pseudobacteriovorax antillogorgiicola TaxID=1513793 RepID=A0A1Y6BRW2_9BACT|nr:response regulator [Pseudobacteriovorax antillogorgiicola]TCS54596.1 response regulator receiver domain-containing protein [Pseudobacteriovorax antillogorgiicola]SMF17685.1 Response regulator receiver domain-containing protein [Pseudobacteriovorax antillogorgiicola]
MTNKLIKMKTKSSFNQESRKAFLEELHGHQADESWQSAVAQDEPWALTHEAKRLSKSSLLDERQQADSLSNKLKEQGFVSRADKIRKLREARQNRAKLMVLASTESTVEASRQLENCDIEVFNNPKLALEAIKLRDFSAYIIDFDLPLANGLQFMTSIHHQDFEHRALVILVAKDITPEMIKQGRTLSVNHWLIPDDLEKKLAGAVAQLKDP